MGESNRGNIDCELDILPLEEFENFFLPILLNKYFNEILLEYLMEYSNVGGILSQFWNLENVVSAVEDLNMNNIYKKEIYKSIDKKAFSDYLQQKVIILVNTFDSADIDTNDEKYKFLGLIKKLTKAEYVEGAVDVFIFNLKKYLRGGMQFSHTQIQEIKSKTQLTNALDMCAENILYKSGNIVFYGFQNSYRLFNEDVKQQIDVGEINGYKINDLGELILMVYDKQTKQSGIYHVNKGVMLKSYTFLFPINLDNVLEADKNDPSRSLAEDEMSDLLIGGISKPDGLLLELYDIKRKRVKKELRLKCIMIMDGRVRIFKHKQTGQKYVHLSLDGKLFGFYEIDTFKLGKNVSQLYLEDISKDFYTN